MDVTGYNGYAPLDTRFCFPGAKVAISTAVKLAAGTAANICFCRIASVTDQDTIVLEDYDSSGGLDLGVHAGEGVVADGYIVYGDSNVNSLGKEFIGMGEIVDTTGGAGSLHLVDPATYPRWAPIEMTATNFRNLTENLMLRAIIKFETENGKYPDLIANHVSMMVEYFDELKGDRRFIGLEKAEGGSGELYFRAPKVGRVEMWFDRFAPPYEQNYFRKEWFKYTFMKKPCFMTWQDGLRVRPVSGKDEGEAYFHAYGEFVTRNRHMALKLDKLNATVD
jgi:hypothetical protein